MPLANSSTAQASTRAGRRGVLVVGSANMDLVVRTPRIPALGETVLGGDFRMIAGGKGANQAVGAARLGASVIMIARLGADLFGERLFAGLQAEGIDCTDVLRDPDRPTGVAIITVDERGRNCIVVAPGSNAALTPADLDRAAESFAHAGTLLLQYEIPPETAEHAINRGRAAGMRVMVNPAPAREISPECYARIDVLIPNQTEAAMLAGMSACDDREAVIRAARRLRALGCRAVVITLGEAGVCVLEDHSTEFIPACKVQAVDTTAAGDAFCAALACALDAGYRLVEAARLAARAAALSVTRYGAQPSLPRSAEIEGWLRQE